MSSIFIFRERGYENISLLCAARWFRDPGLMYDVYYKPPNKSGILSYAAYLMKVRELSFKTFWLY
jgi:hypothetical protein